MIKTAFWAVNSKEAIEFCVEKIRVFNHFEQPRHFCSIAKRVDKVDGKNSGGDAMVRTTLHNALRTLGSYEKWRTRLVDLCRDIEQDLNLPNLSVRDEVTGPLIDALHTDVGTLKKVLKSGVIFEFKYCSKIGRAFVLSPEAKPDHVWEPQTTKLLVYLATNARHIAIGGAYFGDQAILVAKKQAETGGICHAFEPNKEQFAMLERNARNNGLNNMMLNCIGLWENDKTILRLVGNDAFAYSKVVTAQSSQLDDSTFPTISLNTYGKQHNIDRFDLIMLDLEGTELPALRGADRYLDQPPDSAPHIIFEVHRSYVDWSNGLENTDIVRFLVNFGYYIFAIRDFQSNFPMGDQPIELIPPESTYLKGPPHGFNMLAVKNLGVIQNDFFRICHNVSPKLLLHKSRSLHYPTTGL